jgi:hypothetical protein
VLVPLRVPRFIAEASIPRLLLAASLTSYAIFFVLMLAFGRPGLGFGEGFNLPVVLAALVTGPLGGAAAGLFAGALFEGGLLDHGRVAVSGIVSTPTEIRVVGYVGVGLVVGYFATRGRRLLSDALHVLDELLTLAGRDLTTATLASPGLELAMSRRLAQSKPFTLLVVEPASRQAGRRRGRLGYDEEDVRRITSQMAAELPPGTELARVGPKRFAALVATRSSDEARDVTISCERALGNTGFGACTGWAESPADGTDVFSLLSVAVERLYADLLVRGEWEPRVYDDALSPAGSAGR